MKHSFDNRTEVAVIDIGDTQPHSHAFNNLAVDSVQHTNHISDVNHNSNHVSPEDIDWKSHCHPNKSDKSDIRAANRAFRQLLAGTVLCFLFMVAEIIGGALANSLAIMTGKT